jgi:hypothetical protein
MEHQTGPDEPGTADAAEAAAPVASQSGPEQLTSAAEGSTGLVAATEERRAEPVPSTGEPRVDAALTLLDRLPELPVSEHAVLFERVHAQLSDVLGELDSGPAGPAGG